MSCKFIIGEGRYLEYAFALWSEVDPQGEYKCVGLKQDKSYRYDYGFLSEMDPEEATAFVAVGPDFMNLRRLELMGKLKSLGFKMPSLISKSAALSDPSSIGENALIGPGAIIEPGVIIGFNSYIGAGALIGFNSVIGSSVWVDPRVIFGAKCVVKNFSLFRSGANVQDGCKIGKNVEIGVNQLVHEDIFDNTFFMPRFKGPAVIVNLGPSP